MCRLSFYSQPNTYTPTSLNVLFKLLFTDELKHCGERKFGEDLFYTFFEEKKSWKSYTIRTWTFIMTGRPVLKKNVRFIGRPERLWVLKL